jgi:hypothetical protein
MPKKIKKISKKSKKSKKFFGKVFTNAPYCAKISANEQGYGFVIKNGGFLP